MEGKRIAAYALTGAQKPARHASIGTTMNVYTSIEDGLQKQAMRRLQEAIRQPVGVPTGTLPGEKLRKVR
jgi:hypothetical protein